MTVQSYHTLAYCSMCETDMVKCGTCGNNCCNGGSGEVDGDDCPDCEDAYDMQALYWKDISAVEFQKDERKNESCPL